MLEAAGIDFLNCHPSLLPAHRGPNPYSAAIRAGDTTTGVTVHRVDATVDTGPVLLRARMPIGAEETAGELQARLARMGAELIVEALEQLDALVPEPQPAAGVSYAAKIDKAEARVDWTRPAEEVDRQIRGLSPFPGAWCEIGGARVKLLGARLAEGSGAPGEALDDALTVACGVGAVALTRLQRAGKGAQEAPDFLRGWPVARGTRL